MRGHLNQMPVMGAPSQAEWRAEQKAQEEGRE
jgi:hypothetical protein